MAGSDNGDSAQPAGDPRRGSTTSLAGSDDFQDAQQGTDTPRAAEGSSAETDPPAGDSPASPQTDAPSTASSSAPPPPAAAASSSSLHLPLADGAEPEPASPDELIPFLRGQITDLTGQVTSLNSKLVKSYTTRGELEDDLHDAQENERNLRKKVADLERERAKWDKEIEAGGWVEKNHVQGEMQRLMTKVVEETKSRETAVQAHSALETEIENLTSNLFSEANKMVAFERVARARAEEKTRSVEEAGVSMQALLEEVQVGLRETVVKLEKRDAEVADLKRRLAAHGEHVEEDDVEGREQDDGDVGGIVFSDGEHLTLNTQALNFSLSLAATPSHLSAPRLLTSVLPYHEFLAFITYLRQTRTTALNKPQEHMGYAHPALAARAFSSAESPPPAPLTPAQLLAPHLLLSSHLSQPFLKRCVEEDSDAALRLDLAPGLGFLSRRTVGTAIVDGTLLIEPLHAGHELASDKCALCGCSLEKWLPNSGILRGIKSTSTAPTVASVNQTMRKLGSSLFSRSGSSSNVPTATSTSSFSSSYASSSSTEAFTFPPPPSSASHHPHDASLQIHVFRPTDTASQRYPVCPSYCLARLRAVCEFWTYIRVIERGLLLEEGFRFGQTGRPGDAAAQSGAVTPARGRGGQQSVAQTPTRERANEGLGLGAVAQGDEAAQQQQQPSQGGHEQHDDEGVQAKDFEAEDTHGEPSEKGTPQIVEPERDEQEQDKEEKEQDKDNDVNVEDRRTSTSSEGSPKDGLTQNANGSTSSLSATSAAKPPRPSRSSARNSPVVSAPSSPAASPRLGAASAPALPPRKAASGTAPPPRHPSLASAPGQSADLVANAIGWEDRCWSEVVRLKESVFWTRVAAVAPDGGEVSSRGARVWLQ
ncbi:uncharacterized protein JCM10292_006241 [Rhodotorula paludigena]|uniref:uncharacterized protein n=1 Tax=Rhodotorula paludigena TaxID=86838 RepID=UPI00317E5A81